MQFQSTRPVRGATAARHIASPPVIFQSTRPMRGATPLEVLLAEAVQFQSTRPMRGATIDREVISYFVHISIHAPHAGRDSAVPLIACSAFYFNPRAPCGARLALVALLIFCPGFQSTRPMRGATWIRQRRQVHALHFNPRAPCGARHVTRVPSSAVPSFQSTRPMRGATFSSCEV